MSFRDGVEWAIEEDRRETEEGREWVDKVQGRESERRGEGTVCEGMEWSDETFREGSGTSSSHLGIVRGFDELVERGGGEGT